MTDLEEYIYDSVKDRIPELLEKIRAYKYNYGWVEVPFACGMCIDYLVYSVSEDRFVSIRYYKGIKDGESIGGLMSKYEAYFDLENIKEFEFNI